MFFSQFFPYLYNRLAIIHYLCIIYNIGGNVNDKFPSL